MLPKMQDIEKKAVLNYPDIRIILREKLHDHKDIMISNTVFNQHENVLAEARFELAPSGFRSAALYPLSYSAHGDWWWVSIYYISAQNFFAKTQRWSMRGCTVLQFYSRIILREKLHEHKGIMIFSQYVFVLVKKVLEIMISLCSCN